jgi:glycerophosphoryl diester phosphodiesterase
VSGNLEWIVQDVAVTLGTPCPGTTIGFAHRGARAERRENTLEAFSRALELGATGLESDAWITADGIVVLDHDGVIGPIWRRRAISAQNREDLPGHIPSLAELYRECGAGYELSLDVKDPAALEPIIAEARKVDAAHRLWLCHHDWRLAAGWKRISGISHLVESTHVNWMREGLEMRAAALKEAGIDAVNLRGDQWNPERVEQVHRAALAAFAWDAQSVAEIERLLDLGIDGMYSDHVDRMMTAIRARTV